MHLFINTKTEINISGNILEAIIEKMVLAFQDMDGINLVIVRDQYSKKWEQLCHEQMNISLATSLEASNLIKNCNKATVIHFGANTKWASKRPLYFFPILLPSEVRESTFLSRIFFKRNMGKWMLNATNILCSNDWSMSVLLKAYPPYKDKIQKVYLPLKAPVQMAWSELSAVKEALTNGHNYFLIFTPIDRFVAVLKEFSIFKKWQQTTMNLVVILENEKALQKANLLLQGYKFREDIVLQIQGDVNNEWLAASYAILWEGVSSSKFTWVETAIQYDIPLLFDQQMELPESWSTAGEVFLFSEQQALSNHFKLYYKDEVYRQSRARMGKRWLDSITQTEGAQELFKKMVFSHFI